MTIKLTINEQAIEVDAGTTLMEAAATTAVDTPIICYHDATKPEGLCRMCVVEVKGWRTLAPACVTLVSEGMQVTTDSDRVTRARRTILEMLNASVDLSAAPEIQTQMNDYNADRARFPDAKTRATEVIDDNPFYIRDYGKCIMCWRCVQACGDDMQFTYALSTGGRGHDSKISTFFDAPMPATSCVFCGNCVAVCPTDALRSKTEFFMEQGLDYDAIRIEKRKAKRAMGGKK